MAGWLCTFRTCCEPASLFVSYLVHLRTREIGIRMAMGATTEAVRLSVIINGVPHCVAGVVLGAAFATRILTAMVFDVAPQDPMTLVIVSIVLVTMSIIATLIPSL